MTELKSKEIFGNINPVGQTINYYSDAWGSILLTVTAVIVDYPQNSSLEFDGLISESTLDAVKWYKQGKNHWGSIQYLSFVKVDNPQRVNALAEEMNKLMQTHAPKWVLEDDLPYELKPLNKLYFDTGYANDLLKHNNRYKLILILIVGVLILTIACINYINLATAQASTRQKGINIQKTIGAMKSRVFIQLIFESVSLASISFLLALFVIFMVLPTFNNLTGSSFLSPDIFNIPLFLKSFFMVLIVGIITGIFPAHILSSQRIPSLTTKVGLVGSNPSKLRNSLIVVQFVFTIMLIISTLAISKQVKLFTNKQAGFDKEKMFYTYLPSDFDDKKKSLREELMRIPEVANVGFSSQIPGNINDGEWGTPLEYEGQSKRVIYHGLRVSEDFMELFGLKIIEGKSFKYGFPSLDRPVIINETAVREFGLNDPLNARIQYSGEKNVGNIVGVVKDFNYRSLHYKMGSMVLILQPNSCNILNIKINTGNLSQTAVAINKIRKVWNNCAIDLPFEMHFLDYELQNLYSTEMKFLKTFNLFAAISIFISCIGLLGLSLFIVEKRTKEIGIRKVNGAKVSEILTMLNKDFIKWVAIAFVIACPIAYYAMNKWLENFAYKTTLSW